MSVNHSAQSRIQSSKLTLRNDPQAPGKIGKKRSSIRVKYSYRQTNRCTHTRIKATAALPWHFSPAPLLARLILFHARSLLSRAHCPRGSRGISRCHFANLAPALSLSLARPAGLFRGRSGGLFLSRPFVPAIDYCY